ncbi:hypothetical protein AB1Y20_014871 [Prymnesium parvum]|uniref:Iron-binding zinc finger CDGSH type domain-containing protein n=1 Tax=Prymnesium parvum TaxID=97485 RepID=A0AB34JVG3_PRYPA|mmetsp:Transcript_9338/g.20816  ORF Transcript_9338/g.20816 Transcript_9338/m.20816 type:complete len:99 (+) Transcript_9338:50-346(+)
MLRLALLLLAAIASQALLLQPGAVTQSRTRTVVMSKINESIDKENPKVVTMVKAKEIEGAKAVYCRCWKSGTFPLCDGAHVKHNKETEDNVGPLIVEK